MNALKKQHEPSPRKPGSSPATAGSFPGKRTLQGTVVRRSGDKTVAVEVARSFRHHMYGKNVKNTKRYLVHDETNVLKEGDQVVIQESRPLSRRKRWIIVKK